MKTHVIMAVLFFAFAASLLWAGEPVVTNSTPDGVVRCMIASQLSGDYTNFISCISEDGFAKLGIKKDPKLFAAMSQHLKPILKKYEVRLVETKQDRAVVELTTYGIREDKGMKEVRTFEVLREHHSWFVNTDINMSKKPFPADEIRRMISQQPLPQVQK